MATFVVIVLGPACLFFLYALVQFWREARRPRPRLQPALPWCVTRVTVLSAGRHQGGAQQAASFEGNKEAGVRNVVSITRLLSRRLVERDVA
jgi:hypothetical protein